MPDAARDSAVRSAVKVAAEWLLMFTAEDDLDAIGGIEAPTLLVCGGRTRRPARRVVEIVRQALPHARYHEIADAGHMSPLTHPADIAAAIRHHVCAVNPQRRSAAKLASASNPMAAGEIVTAISFLGDQSEAAAPDAQPVAE
jgi:hypothetical protein